MKILSLTVMQCLLPLKKHHPRATILLDGREVGTAGPHTQHQVACQCSVTRALRNALCQQLFVPPEQQTDSSGDLNDMMLLLSTAVSAVRQRHHVNTEDKGHKRKGNKHASVTELFWSMTVGDERADPRKLLYSVGPKKVCRDCYLAAADLLQRPKLDRPCKVWVEGQRDYMTRDRGSSPSKKSLKEISTSKWYGKKLPAAFGWLVQHCQAETGEDVQGSTDGKLHLCGTTLKNLHEDYNKWLLEKGQQHMQCSGACFNAAYHQMNSMHDQPTLTIDKWSFHAECATCVALKVLKRRAAASKDAEMVALRNAQLEHHKSQARNERLTYAWRISRGLHFKFSISICMDGYDVRKGCGPALHCKLTMQSLG